MGKQPPNTRAPSTQRSGPSRRAFLKKAAVAGMSLAGSFRPLAAAEKPSFGLRQIGRVKAVASGSIPASPLSVGFETLDRKMFDPAQTYQHLARVGVKWARCQTGWCRCEPEKSRLDFTWLDEVVNSLLAIGIQPWFNLGYGNKLYTPQAPTEVAVGWAPIFSKTAESGWLRFVKAIAGHFRGRVRHWEIWNEPNIQKFWQPQKPNPADYARLVRITAPVIRQQVPDAVIIGGALAGMPVKFLSGCLESGLSEHVDRISFHPYRALPEQGYEKDLAALRSLLAEYNPKIKLWQGECGCPSKSMPDAGWSFPKAAWTESRQAKWLTRRILTDLCLGIELTSYFHTVDLLNYNWGEGPSGHDQFMGLLRGDDYTAKPSYSAYQHVCALFDARTRRDTSLKLELTSGPKVLLQEAGFVRFGHALYVYWFPADLFKPWEQRSIAVRIKASQEAVIHRPALVDTISGQVFELTGVTRDDDMLTIDQLPLVDYPLILTDQQVALPG